MPFDKPDLLTLITRTTSDLTSRWPGAFNRLRRTVLAVFARVLAGLAYGLYGYLDWIADQILPDKMELTRLRRFGAIYGVPYTDANQAGGNLSITGSDGSVMPAGKIWQRSDGVEYAVTEETTISGGAALVPVSASVAGAAGNASAGEAVYIVSPVPGVNPTAVVASGGITGGVDAMDVDTAYRSRVLTRTAISYTGANRAVYERWAKEVAGVTRAWAYEATPAPGSLTVLIVCDGLTPIIPNAGMIADVEDYLEEHTDPITGQTVGRAVNVTLVVSAPTPQAVNFSLAVSPNSTSVKSAVAAELADLLRREAEPGTDILISHIRDAISNAAGVTDYALTVPSADVAVPAGSIATMGTVTWA